MIYFLIVLLVLASAWSCVWFATGGATFPSECASKKWWWVLFTVFTVEFGVVAFAATMAFVG